MKLKQILISFLAIYALLFTIACPVKPADIEKVRSHSKKAASYANQGVNVTRGLFEQKIITPDQTIKIGEGFKKLAQFGQAFDAAVEKAAAAYGKNVPRSEIEKLFETFDDEIVGTFVGLLEDMARLNNAALWRETISLIKIAVLAVARVFKQESKVAARIEAAGAAV